MTGVKGSKSQKAADVPAGYSEDFLSQMDGRLHVAKTLRQRLSDLTGDLGGEGNLSYAERSLCRRAVHLERCVEQFESTLAHGGTVEFNHLFGLVNALSGIYSKLGLRRRPKQVLTVDDYLAKRSEESADEVRV